MKNTSWKSKCLDMMKQAEYDKELMDGLVWLSRKAIKETKSIYDVIKEVLTTYQEKKEKFNQLQKFKKKNNVR